MNLHAKNIALVAGVPSNLVMETVEFMKARGRFSIDVAKDYMNAHEIFSRTRNLELEQSSKTSD